MTITTAASACSRPHDVHFGLAAQRMAERAGVLATAYAAHPERFPAGRPAPTGPPTEVWINHSRPDSFLSTGSGRWEIPDRRCVLPLLTTLCVLLASVWD
jgi:hypothetical protein